MARRNPPAKWVLPATVNPPSSKCFTVNVPDDPAYIAAFRGSMLDLASAYKWADDTEHTAVSVANVWKNVINNMGVCSATMFDIRLKPGDPCTVQKTTDGITWVDAFSTYACAVGAAGDYVAQAITDGLIAPGVQQAPAGVIPADTCKTWFVTLNANSRWLCPSPIASGYTITVQNANGGWVDTPLGIWRCPSGGAYALGFCTVGTVTSGTDPMPTQPHMRLIGSYSAVYVDAYNTSFVIPAGVSSTNFYLQPNDSSLSDNQGSITLKVTVCNYPTAFVTGAFGGTVNRASVRVGDTVVMTLGAQHGAYYEYNGGIAFSVPVKGTVVYSGMTDGGNPSSSVWNAANTKTDYNGYQVPDPTFYFREIACNSLTQGTVTVQVTGIQV